MIYLIIILAIAQAYTLYLIREIKKGNVQSYKPSEDKQKEDFLRTLCSDIKYSDIDPEYQTIYNILETIKIEDWQFEILDYQVSNYSIIYNFKFNSNNDNSHVIGVLRKYESSPFQIGFLNCKINGNIISLIDEFKKKSIRDDLVSFIYYYIVKYYQEKNKKSLNAYKDNLTNINISLKTLNRSKKLNDILGNDC